MLNVQKLDPRLRHMGGANEFGDRTRFLKLLLLWEGLDEFGPRKDVNDLVLLVVRLLRAQGKVHRKGLDLNVLFLNVPTTVVVYALIFVERRRAGFSRDTASTCTVRRL